MLTDTGREKIARVVAGLDAQESYDMLLYTNNYSVVEATVLTDLTEAGPAGYARQTLNTFAAPTGPVGGVWTTLSAYLTFTNSSGVDVTVYGWAYVGHSSGVLYGGDKFPVALTLAAGSTLTFSPGLSFSTL